MNIYFQTHGCTTNLSESEIMMGLLRKAGFKIKEIPVTHYPRKAGKSVFEGKLTNLPKPKVVFDLLKEMRILWRDMREKN